MNNNQMQNSMNFMSASSVHPSNQGMPQYYNQNQMQMNTQLPNTQQSFPHMRIRVQQPQIPTNMSMSIPNSNQNPQMNFNSINITQQQQMLMQQSMQIPNRNPQINMGMVSQMNMQPQIKNNIPMQPLSQSQQIHPAKKQRLYLKMTNEERGFFSNLYQIADKDNKGKLVGKEAADFLKKSGLPKEILKRIWIISAQTNAQFLERDEFYIALRLVALAQNNLPISEECIIKNAPIPPLPVFDLKKTSNPADLDAIFAMSEKDKDKYKMFFDKNKEYNDKITIPKSCQMWKSANVSDDNIRQILAIVQPLRENGFLSLQEFQVCTHFVFKSVNNVIPKTLPNCLSIFLFGKVNNNEQQAMPQQQQEKKDLDSLMSNMNILQPSQMQNNQPNMNIPPQQQNVPIQNVPSTNQVVPPQQPKPETFKKTDEDLLLVSTLVEEIEKVVRTYNDNNNRNEQLRLQIHEVKDKIRIGKERLVKLALLVNTKNEELMTTMEELTKIKADYSSVLKDKEQLQADFEKEQVRVAAIKAEREKIIRSNQEELKQLELERKNEQMKLNNNIPQQPINTSPTMQPPEEIKIPQNDMNINTNQEIPQPQLAEQKNDMNFPSVNQTNPMEEHPQTNTNFAFDQHTDIPPQNTFGTDLPPTNTNIDMNHSPFGNPNPMDNPNPQSIGGFNFDMNPQVDLNIVNPYEASSPFDFDDNTNAPNNMNMDMNHPDMSHQQGGDQFNFPNTNTLPSFDSVIKSDPFDSKAPEPNPQNPFGNVNQPNPIQQNTNFNFDNFGDNTNQDAFEEIKKTDSKQDNFKADDWDF